MNTWQLQEAKSHLSEVVKQAMQDGPQHITLRGEPAVVVMSTKEFNKLKKPQKSLVEFIKQSPLFGAELNTKRNKSTNRNIDL